MKTYWGYHLLLDCREGKVEEVRSAETITEFATTLVDAIDMRAYGEPIVKHFAEHDAEAAGYSLVQLIETSLISGHFVDANGDFFIDVFSCKTFDPDVAKSVVERFFAPKAIRARFLERTAR